MNEVTIDNPFSVEEYNNNNWDDLKNAFNHVISSFPKEYRIVNEDNERKKMVILQTTGQFNGNDQIIFISAENNEGQFAIKYEGSNQNRKMTSFAEQQALINKLETFKALVLKSLNGTLDAAINNVNAHKQRQESAKKTELGMQAIIQLIIAVVAIFMIFNVMKGCS